MLMNDCQHETDASCDIMLELDPAFENRMNGLSAFITFALLKDKISACLLEEWPGRVIACDILL